MPSAKSIRKIGAVDDDDCVGNNAWFVKETDAVAGEKERRLWALNVVGVWNLLPPLFEWKLLIVAAWKTCWNACFGYVIDPKPVCANTNMEVFVLKKLMSEETISKRNPINYPREQWVNDVRE